jgi:hypothetical protein
VPQGEVPEGAGGKSEPERPLASSRGPKQRMASRISSDRNGRRGSRSPIENRRFGAVPLRHLRRIGLDLMPAILAPHDQPDPAAALPSDIGGLGSEFIRLARAEAAG